MSHQNPLKINEKMIYISYKSYLFLIWQAFDFYISISGSWYQKRLPFRDLRKREIPTAFCELIHRCDLKSAKAKSVLAYSWRSRKRHLRTETFCTCVYIYEKRERARMEYVLLVWSGKKALSVYFFCHICWFGLASSMCQIKSRRHSV